jgi:hypothetical protein
MRYTYALLLLALMGWPGGGGSSILAQDTALQRRPLSSEDTALNPGVPPTPQFLQVEVDIGAGGLSPIRLRAYPPWVARPQVRVGQARTEPPPEGDTAPLLEGGADQLHHALAQALDRAQSPAAPSP